MGINDLVDLLPGSDHLSLRVDLWLGSGNSVDPPIASLGFYLNPKRDMKGSRNVLSSNLS